MEKYLKIFIFVIFCLQLSLASSQITNFVSTSCSNSSQCGANALCNAQTAQCICKLGFLFSPNNFDCDQFKCSSNSSCHTHFGPLTFCATNRWVNQQCVCNPDLGYKTDPETQKCIPISNFLNTSCEYSSDCGLDAFCNPSKLCQCKFGVVPDSIGMNCNKFYCSKNSDCDRFGEHVICDRNRPIGAEAECSCNYTPGWVLDSNTQTCTNGKQFVGQNCSKTNQCGMYSVCNLKNKCQCELGTKADPEANINCYKTICKDDAPCKTQDPNSVCENQNCKCPKPYRVFSGNQTCIAHAQFVNGNCLEGFGDCGENAECVGNKCRCWGGFVSKNGIDCVMSKAESLGSGKMVFGVVFAIVMIGKFLFL